MNSRYVNKIILVLMLGICLLAHDSFADVVKVSLPKGITEEDISKLSNFTAAAFQEQQEMEKKIDEVVTETLNKLKPLEQITRTEEGKETAFFDSLVVLVDENNNPILPDLAKNKDKIASRAAIQVAAQNELTFVWDDQSFISNGIPQATLDQLKSDLIQYYPKMKDILGPPFFNINVKIRCVKMPAYAGYYNASTNTLTLDYYAHTITIDTLIHEVAHAFHDDLMFINLLVFEEGTAQAISNLFFDSYPIALDYELINQFYIAGLNGSASVYNFPHQVLLKIYFTDRDFFRKWNEAVIDSGITSFDYAKMIEIIKGVAPSEMEGQDFDTWREGQYGIQIESIPGYYFELGRHGWPFSFSIKNQDGSVDDIAGAPYEYSIYERGSKLQQDLYLENSITTDDGWLEFNPSLDTGNWMTNRLLVAKHIFRVPQQGFVFQKKLLTYEIIPDRGRSSQRLFFVGDMGSLQSLGLYQHNCVFGFIDYPQEVFDNGSMNIEYTDLYGNRKSGIINVNDGVFVSYLNGIDDIGPGTVRLVYTPDGSGVQYEKKIVKGSGSYLISLKIPDTVSPTALLKIQRADGTDSEYTNSRSVELDSLNASATLVKMRFSTTSKDSGFGDEIPWAYHYDYTNLLSSGDGLKTVWVKYQDEAGNWSTAEIKDTITLDTVVPPNPSSVAGYNDISQTASLTSGSWYNYPGPYFKWAAPTDPAPASGIAGYYLYFGTSATADPTVWQSTLTYTAYNLTSGNTYYLRIKTKDNAGNISVAQTKFTYKYDATNPDTGITSPAGATYTTKPNFNGTASDSASGVASVKVSIKRGDTSKYWNGSSWVSGETWVNASGTTSWSYTLPDLTNNVTYFLKAKAYDVAGNSDASPSQVSFRYATATPIAISNLSITKSGSLYNITFDLNRSGAVTGKIETTLGVLKRQFATAVSCNAGTNTLTWDGKDSSGSPLPSGAYLVKVTATGGGSTTIATKTFQYPL